MIAIDRLTTTAEENPSRVFWAFALLHAIVWTALPAFLAPNAPLDVIEGYAWGRDWIIGTNKHPPLQAWLLEMSASVTGRTSWSHYLLSQLSVFVAFIAVWKTGLRIADAKTALFGAMLLEGIGFYNFVSMEFNPNILQIPFWALICLFFHRAIKDDKWSDWLLLGVWAAGGMYAKYSVFLLLMILAFMMFTVPEARAKFRGRGPYLTFFVALSLFLPHLRWLFENGFSPLEYAASRTEKPANMLDYLANPFDFAVAQAFISLFAVLLFLALSGGKIGFDKNRLEGFDKIFLNTVAFAPFVVVMAVSLATGERPRDAWGACLWNFLGLWATVYLLPQKIGRRNKIFIYSWLCVFIAFVAAAAAGYAYLDPAFMKKPSRVYFPGEKISAFIGREWENRFDSKLEFVIGDVWPAGNVAYYYPMENFGARPRTLVFGDSFADVRISEDETKKKGAVLVWCGAGCSDEKAAREMPPRMKAEFPEAETQLPIIAKQQSFVDVRPATIGWAIVPPR